MDQKLHFNEKTIQEIFGHEVAEEENKSRLRRYYFKSRIGDQVRPVISATDCK